MIFVMANADARARAFAKKRFARYNSGMQRCRQKAEYELRTDGTCIQSGRAKCYRCGSEHYEGEVFLCHAHAHVNGDTELAEWFRRVMG
jgi:hypothetical protein